MKLKHVLWVIYGLAALSILFLFLMFVHPVFLCGTIIALLAMAVVNLRFWRCPSCDKNLGRTIGKYCPHCGAALDMA